LKSVQYLSALLVTGAVGCLAVPGDDTQPMCEASSECDQANGEICADGVCWGDPPDVLYAARIGPPNNRGGLVATEITKIQIEDNGWFTTSLRLEEPVTITGTVLLACGESPCPAIASTITVTRPARIPGGPPFFTTAHTTEGSGQFSIEVPRANPDESYSVVISPDRANDDAVNLDAVAPKRLILTPTDYVDNLVVELGDDARAITGVIRDEQGVPLPGVKVVLRGRWEPNSGLTDVSSIATTGATGAFSVQVTGSTVEPDVDLVLVPPTDFELRPTLHVDMNLDTSLDLGVLQFPYMGTTHVVTIPVTGTSMMGVVEAIANAEVTVIAEKEFPGVPFGFRARVELSRTTDARGEVEVPVVDGQNLTYEIRVQPPAQSGAAQYATIYGMPVEFAGVSTLDAIHLASQVAVHGKLFDHAGRPAEGVVVSVVPNASYSATLPEQLQTRLAEAVATSETVHSDGQFAVYVDPSIAGAPAIYDINFEPPQHSLLPSWQTSSVMVDPLTGYDTGDFDLPEAAYVRGVVYDPDDEPIEGAEVRLYEVPPSILPCQETLEPADPTCAQKAILRALTISDSGGSAHLVLPDP
jgi:hypothetical protein